MVAETVMQPKKFCKRRGRKVFSVPVGKLRSKLIGLKQNRSSSKSGSKSASRHQLLLMNNRELARALTCEKERFRGLTTENVNLKARLHESQLAINGLEKQLCEIKESLAVYQNSMVNHIKNSVKHSVSLTESLKLALGLCISGPKDSFTLNASGCSVPTTASQPQRLRVNPMISGHTIRHPTISLRRVVMSSRNVNLVEENVVEENVVEENVAPSEEQTPEIIDDVLQSLEETQERPGGLSTCLEEDEDCNVESNLNEQDDEEEDNEDSFRRKVVSFRNTTLGRDRNRSEVEAEKSSSNEIHQTLESIAAEQDITQNCEMPNDFKQSPRLDKVTITSGNFSERNPVVTLNDISRFLQNSNSVNVQKVILDIHNSKSGDIVGGRACEGSANEKENLPKSSAVKKSAVKQSCVSSGVNLHPLKGTSEMCIKGSIEINNFPCNKKRATGESNSVTLTNVEDPLEGTSWMHLDFSEQPRRKKKLGSQISNEKTSSESLGFKKHKNGRRKIVNTLKENMPDCLVENQSQEENELLMHNTRASSANESDTSDFDKGLKDCHLAQSTPKNHGNLLQNGHISSASDVPKSTSKSSRGDDYSNSFASLDDYCPQGNSPMKEGEKKLAVSPVDTKFECKQFVTIRVRKLNFPDLSSTDTLASNPHEVNCGANLSDEVVDFLGFNSNCESEERLMVMKNMMGAEKDFGSRENYRNCSTTESIPSISSADLSHGRMTCFEVESYDASAAGSGRPKRRAAPTDLKEPLLTKKLRQERIKPKKRRRQNQDNTKK